MSRAPDTERAIIDKILENEGLGWNREEGSYHGIMPKTYEKFQEATGTGILHSELLAHSETVHAFYKN